MATFTGQANTDDQFSGTVANDVFRFAVADLNALDMIFGNGGQDRLVLITAGALATNALAGMQGVGRITLSSGGNRISLFDAQYSVAIKDSRIQVNSDIGVDFVDASALSEANSILFIGRDGIDTVLGGAGDDIFQFNATNLSADTVRGNGGNDRLDLSGVGTFSYFDLNDVQGVETFRLTSGDKHIQIANRNFLDTIDSTITVLGNIGDDWIDGSAVTGANTLIMNAIGGGADTFFGGAGNDLFLIEISDIPDDVIRGNGGFDILTLRASGALDATQTNGISGIERIELANGTNSIVLSNLNMSGVLGQRITVVGNDGDDTIVGSFSAAFAMDFIGGSGKDFLRGGLGNDIFYSKASDVAGDRMWGGGGIDALSITTGGFLSAVALANMQNVSQIMLSDSGNGITILDANFGGVLHNDRIKVIGGTGNDNINASGLSASNRVELLGGAGTDTLRGGAGDDLFRSAASHLSGDTLLGNGGFDTLSIESPVVQTVNILSNVQGIEQINLADGWNRVVLHDANFNGVEGAHIAISGGTGRDIMSALPVTGARTVLFEGNGGDDVLKGGAAADRLVGGLGADELAGGGGADHFIWDAPVEGGDVLIDFQPGIDNLEFDGAAFGLTDASFDVRSQGGSDANLATTDLFVHTGVLNDAAAVQAMLDVNGTGRTDEALFVIALDAQNNAIVYHTAFADGSGAVNEMASLGSNIAPVTIGLADFVIG